MTVKDLRLNKKSVLYIPDYVKDLGFTQEEADQLTEKDEDEINARIEIFRRKHREQIELKEVDKAERKRIELLSHWYRKLTELEIRTLINNSKHLARPILKELADKEKLRPKALHLLKLLNSIENGMEPVIREASDSKVKRFPKYNSVTKKIHGSKYDFAALWSHVYSRRNHKVKFESR